MIATLNEDNPTVTAAVAALRSAPNWVLLVQTETDQVAIFVQVPGDTAGDTAQALETFQQVLVEEFERVRKGLEGG